MNAHAVPFTLICILQPRLALLLAVGLITAGHAQETIRSPQELLGTALNKWATVIEPGADAPSQTFSATLRVVEADGFNQRLVGQAAEIAFQAPDRLRFSTRVQDRELRAGRSGQELWIYAPATRFGVVGSPEVPRFGTRPDSVDRSVLPPFRLPLAREQLALLPLLLQLELLPPETVHGAACQVLRAAPYPQAIQALKIPNVQLTLWIRESDSLPARVEVADEDQRRLLVELEPVRLGEPFPAGAWEMQPAAESSVERVARAHLERFVPGALSLLNLHIPTLGPAVGEKRVLAVEGAGRLEDHDGTKVLFLSGTPEEMGHQHGVLMRKEVRDLVSKVVYGVGVASSFEKGRWFFSEIEEAQERTAPFVDERYLREMDALALAAGLDREEVRLANFFPELFHCSGFALYGQATVDGRMYHGRILDYLRGVGLERNAAVIVHQPEVGHAWVNIGYGGFVGSVTAMNAQHISIGEMGGRGEGHWDGKPMAQLIREVMEKASTLDEAIEIMRQGPRTCEYYYVIADGRNRTAVGIAATTTQFEVVRAGEAHPLLPHAIADTVVLSAGDRYETLARRVQDGFGHIDAEAARRLMDRPVAMTSNIHSVLFAPDSLDFWVANADSRNVASHTRYTHYNLTELLADPP
jgi:outer membrane lipoprotein-sorting protein